MLRLLHLSDLHFRPGDPEDRDSAGRALLATAADWAASGEAPQLVLVAGDLVQHGDRAAYPVAARFLDRLRGACGGLPREHVLCVPGNQDVDRAAGRRLQRTLASTEDAALFFSDPAERALHRRKLQGYIDFASSYYGDGAAERSTVQLAVGTRRVGVLLLWTAWFSQGDEDREQLWVGEGGVKAAGEALSDCDLTVALMHHGPDWLHPGERQAVMTALAAGFDLVCHGHLHGQRPPDHEGTPLYLRPVLGAGSLHRRAQRPSRAFLVEVDGQTLSVRPFSHRRGADRWEPEEALGARFDAHAPPRAFPMPQRRPPSRTRGRVAVPAAPRDEGLRPYLTALVGAADALPAAVRHPWRDEPLLLSSLYIELTARLGDGEPAPVHGLLREPQVALVGGPGSGKSSTVRCLGGQIARLLLGMPGEAEDLFRGGEVPTPLALPLDRVAAARPSPQDLLAAIDKEARQRCPAVGRGFAWDCLRNGPTLLIADGLHEAAPSRKPLLLAALRDLLLQQPRARLWLCLRPRDEALLSAAFAAGPLHPRIATLTPLRLPERLRLIDRFVQAVSDIPVGMTLFGGAAALDAALRRVVSSAQTAALGEGPLLLTALCWVGARYGLPPQRAELYSHCLGALVENRVRPDAAGVAEFIDEIAESCEPLRSFREGQALEERSDPWAAVRHQLDEPSSYGALRFLGGLLARRSREAAERLLRSLLSEAGGRREAGERAQLIALAAQLVAEMGPYAPDEKVARRVQEELSRLLGELEDRLQRSPLPVRVAIAEGLGRAGDPRLPVDLLEPGAAGRALWVEVPTAKGGAPLIIGRYPLTCAQLGHLVELSGYAPAPEPGQQSVRALWLLRAQQRPNHPATMISFDDALYLCRFLSQADWRYRYDLPTEAEWERAVRQGTDDDRFYPWGGAMEPSFCNTGRRVGRTTPVGVFPAGTAAGGAGCVDLIGNVWEWCQGDRDEDSTTPDGDGQLSLEVLPEARLARGGSFAYLKAGTMRGSFPGTRSEEIGLRLVRRGK